MGKKAYITGASSGIGKEFALQLHKTHDLALIARNRRSLEETVRLIHSVNPQAKVELLVKDLTKEEELELVYHVVSKDRELALLVNNAGYGSSGDFASLDIQRETHQIALNINTVVELTHAALHNLKKRRTGGVINVASIAAFLPAPYSATYAATKAFVKSFSESLHEEAQSYNVYVQALCPGLTHSDFHNRAGIDKTNFPDFLWMNSEQVVRDSLQAMEKNDAVCIPGNINMAALGLTQIVPSPLARKIAGFFLKK